MKRVVVTGLGAITPLGNNVSEFWDNLVKGTCGIKEITKFDTEGYKCHLAAEVKDFDAKQYMDAKTARRMELFCQYAVAAAKEAITDAALDMEKEDADRIGVIVGSGVGGLMTMEEQVKRLTDKGPSRGSPLFITMTIGNMAAGNIAIRVGAKGVCEDIVTACATGTNAIGTAFRNIKHGYLDACIAGGAEGAICGIGVAGFTNLTALSTEEDPKKACRPFDKERNGFVMGDGSGILVLEELEHALARGAKIYGEVVGYGATADAYHVTLPEPTGEGAAKAMKFAMQEAGITPEQVGYINAHGTSTPLNDKGETMAIKSALGEAAKKVAISSTKGNTGHCLGAAGGIEGVICVKAIEEGFIPATINYQKPDPLCDLDIVPNTGRNQDVNVAMSNSLGFGGHNATIIFKKYGE